MPVQTRSMLKNKANANTQLINDKLVVQNNLLKKEIIELKREQSLKNYKLPRDGDKKYCREFMEYCINPPDGICCCGDKDASKQSLEAMMNDPSEYLVHFRMGVTQILIITNKGKVFTYRLKLVDQCFSAKFETLYLDFKVEVMCEYILNYLIIINDQNWKKNLNHHQTINGNKEYFWNIELYSGHKSIIAGFNECNKHYFSIMYEHYLFYGNYDDAETDA
jgi:hypothetical protein